MLARAIRAEAEAFAARGVTLSVTRSDLVMLPASGIGVYRSLRALLHEALGLAARSPVKVAVVDLAGRSVVEVVVTVLTERHAVVLERAFDRHAPGTLDGGFVEGLA